MDPIYEARGEQRIASSSGPILRGFSRLGIGCAVLIAMIGFAVTATVVIDDYSRSVGVSSPPAGVLNPPPISTFVPTVLIGGGITITACLLIVGFFRGLGWVVASFAGD